MALINVGDLFLDTIYADIIFVVDQKEIPGHRLVLAKTCVYFDKLLFGEFLESKSNKVEITGVSAKVFEEVLRFTYKRRLEVNKWTIEDLVSLLAVAHEYQFHPLFSAVIKAIEEKQLDFDSWLLVNSASSVYDSEELRRMCASFAEVKIDDFVRDKDLDKFSAKLICCMLDRLTMFSLNQDQVVKAICNWGKGQSSSEIMSVMQNISWENVSPKITAFVLRELISTVNNVGQHNFWTKLCAKIERLSESHGLNNCISKVDSVVLKKNVGKKFAMPENGSNFFCRLYSDRLVFWFKKAFAGVEIPVKRMEFEVSTKFNIEKIIGYDLKGGFSEMVVSEPLANISWFKYNAVFSDAKHMYFIAIYSQQLHNVSEMRLRNIVIY